jgi:carbamate kinase
VTERIVVALGGNALLRRGDEPQLEAQRTNVALAARSIAELASAYEVVVTHGNGPQVGLLAIEAERADGRGRPLDVLGAETVGMIGYLVDQALANELPGRDIVTLLTQTVVDPRDPAFSEPTKFVGPAYDPSEQLRLERQRGWQMRRDGRYVRRVVPSPEPLRIVELRALRILVDHGIVVVCSGGGGVPVVEHPAGGLNGVEAVVDKDLAAVLLAIGLDADVLLLLTDVDAVHTDWGTPKARPLRHVTPAELRTYPLPAGSMGPKAEAACRFVERTGGRAVIAALDDAVRALAGEAGTVVTT